MEQLGSPERDLKRLVVPDVGQLLETGDCWEPYQLLDAHGARVARGDALQEPAGRWQPGLNDQVVRHGLLMLWMQLAEHAAWLVLHQLFRLPDPAQE
ncbi:hypothetical protein ABZW18_32685 [Streptomyces sp. NPDC004647]|uniref:hypothetical protein n=1 Tax=Streptomyces sp. NPDC004647 TaxID=3154671 RepID=UPI0033B10936